MKIALAVAIFLLNVVLNWPLFLPGDSRYRDSIEGGYMGMARFFAANPNPWGWSPWQYGGLPSQFIYLPGLHYASSLLALFTGLDAPTAYKLLTATATCLCPVTLFLFVLYFTGSRRWALVASLGFTFYSPLYGLIPQIDRDRGVTYLPWHVHVFIKYGEGPHNAGLMLMPLALMALWARERWMIAVAALLLAAVALINWVAALGLAICVLLMLLCAWRAPDGGGLKLTRVTIAGLLAYGLACFWLTPAFIRTVAFNWPLDAFNYQLAITQKWLLAGWIAGILLLRLAAWALKWPFFASFAATGAFAFGFPVLTFYSFAVDVLPESRRYALEFEFFICLAMVAFLRFAWESPRLLHRVCAVAVALPLFWAGLPQMRRYVTQGYDAWHPVASVQTTEYKLAKWLADRKPAGRVLASGGLRFRLNEWFDVQQVGGAFESGLKNRVPVDFAYQIRTLKDARPGMEVSDAIGQMQAMGVEYVVIHGPKSQEHYRDYKNPLMFEGLLERVFEDGDDWVYRVPFRGLANAVRPDEQPANPHRDWIGGYVRAINDTARPQLASAWLSSSVLEVRGPVPQGHDVTVAVSAEEGWAATQDGSDAWLEKNSLGFLVVKAKPSTRASVIRLEYHGTIEQRVMAAVSALTWLGMFVWLWRERRQRSAIVKG